MFDALHRLLTGLDHPHERRTGDSASRSPAVDRVARSSDSRVEDHGEGDRARADTALRPEQSESFGSLRRKGDARARIPFFYIGNNFSNEERIGVIEMLWEVAYSDGALDRQHISSARSPA
jgi:hypothetical protein